MISTAAICDRTKGESISRRNAHGLCYQLRWVCYWQHWCRLSYAYVLLMFRWIKMHSRLALCFVFTYSSSLQGELGSELHLPIIHLSLLVAILFLTISFPDVEYL